jgi:hypothetical protein
MQETDALIAPAHPGLMQMRGLHPEYRLVKEALSPTILVLQTTAAEQEKKEKTRACDYSLIML